MLSVFGALALALAVVGIAGVMVQAVGQRANEIAIRVALGARSSDVLGLVLRHGMMIAMGVAIGLFVSLLVTPVIRSFLWGVRTTDPVTFAVVVAALALVAVMACYAPARRALKVAPIMALRSE